MQVGSLQKKAQANVMHVQLDKQAQHPNQHNAPRARLEHFQQQRTQLNASHVKSVSFKNFQTHKNVFHAREDGQQILPEVLSAIIVRKDHVHQSETLVVWD